MHSDPNYLSAWPYFLSAAVLAAPAADVNQALGDYKLRMGRVASG